MKEDKQTNSIEGAKAYEGKRQGKVIYKPKSELNDRQQWEYDERRMRAFMRD